MRHFAALAAVSLLLASCNEEVVVEAPEGQSQTAEGEVLGGTISDDMLPLTSVTSQAPPVRERASPASDSTSQEASSDESTPTEDAAEPGGLPAPQPQPETEQPAEES